MFVHQSIACVAGGISCASAFVLVAKPWTRVAKPWEDWWRVELNSRLPKLVGFFELCVHQCTRISDWLRALKRQSNVNLYLSSFPREKGLLSNTLMQIESAIEEMHRGSFGFSEYPRGKQKSYTKGRTGERFRGMVCKMALIRLHDFYGSWHLFICRSLLGHSTLLSLHSRVFMKGTSCCVYIRRNLK